MNDGSRRCFLMACIRLAAPGAGLPNLDLQGAPLL